MDHCEIPRWKRLKESLQNLTFEEFVEAYSHTEDAIYIDARTREEYNFGHLPDAINIDYLSPVLADLLEELDPDKSYFVYCHTSRRSLRICVLLKNSGFTKVYHLNEGLQERMDKLSSL